MNIKFWKKKRSVKGFGIDATRHVGSLYFWRCYKYSEKKDDYEEIAVGLGNDKIYFFLGLIVYSGWIEFIFRISGFGQLRGQSLFQEGGQIHG